MTTKELAAVKALWFAYHQATMCGETEQTHHPVCLAVAEALHSSGVCYR